MSCLQNIVTSVCETVQKILLQVWELAWSSVMCAIQRSPLFLMQCSDVCIWPILSQAFLLVGMCALLFSLNILMLVCFWNEYLTKHVRISNFWHPVFLSFIWTDGLKCHLRFRPSNFLQCLWNVAVIWEPV